MTLPSPYWKINMAETRKFPVCEGLDDYEIEYWIERLGSPPVERVRHADHGESYEMSQAHLVRLENGKYAVIIEEGCSCYSSEDAQIEVFPTLERAEENFKEWEKQYANR